MALPVKRSKKCNARPRSNESNHQAKINILHPDIKLYIVPGRIQSKRLQIMQECAKKNGFVVHDQVCNETSLILTEFENEEQVLRNVNIDTEANDWLKSIQIVSTKWLTDSVKQRAPIIPIPQEYKIKCDIKGSKRSSVSPTRDYALYNCYACQRKTPLKHPNNKLTDALDILALHAQLRSSPEDYVRNLAFSKASGVLKSLPFPITKSEQAMKIKNIGKHSLKVIQEILEDGFSDEVQQIKNDNWFNRIKLFTTVYGVGSSIGNRWYQMGLESIDHVKQQVLAGQFQLYGDVEKISYGLAFHRDLNTPLLKAEAENILMFLKMESEKILPGVQLTLTGGFRRGKNQGHDVDILFTHPTQGKESGFLRLLHDRLTEMQLIMYETHHKNSFDEEMARKQLLTRTLQEDSTTIDDFEKFFYIFRMPTMAAPVDFGLVPLDGKILPPRSDFSRLVELAESKRNWKAVRIDLILAPADQFAFAVVGWTGNKDFNRSIRLYAKKKKNMRLTSNGLWSYGNQRRIHAATEKDVFSLLDLHYLEPQDRNV